jgi:hypothetical protein
VTFLKQAFSMLLWRPSYALGFYLTACATLASIIAYGRSVGLAERSVIWGALALVLPLNIVFCAVWRLVGRARRNLANTYSRLLSGRLGVRLSPSSPIRIGLAASYAALVSVVCMFGAACSSITTAIFVQISNDGEAGRFPWGLYVKVFGIEVAFMLLVVLVPAIMWWLWAPSGAACKYEEAVPEETHGLARYPG